ncbi:sialate O-acetylesterase, partial [Escherichia coli]|nr:sialate O-acetylesterase [Escherichia coli]
QYNDIIPADHCLHDVQDMSRFNHPKADLSKGQYGCVGQGLHIAKKLLPFIPANAGILLVPCCRGSSAFTIGTDGTYSDASGASENSARWGVDKPLYKDLISRTKAALAKNPKNVLLAVVWMQGEVDFNGTPANHTVQFSALVDRYRADLADMAGQCTGGAAVGVPWICGDTTYFWKQKNEEAYRTVYGGYKNKTEKNIHFVPFMTDESGANVLTNKPEEDPDIPGIGYYGSKWRDSSATWTSGDRASHFSSWARRGIISDRLATAIIEHAGKTEAFIYGRVTLSAEKMQTGEGAEPDVNPAAVRPVLSYDANAEDGEPSSQGWTLTDVKHSLVSDGEKTALRLEKTEDGLLQKKSWKVSHAVDGSTGKTLFDNGGEISLRFKIPDDAVLTPSAHQYVAGIYWCGAGWPGEESEEGYIASFFLQTDGTSLDVMYHKNTSSQRTGTYGAFDHGWHTLTFRFRGGGSLNVIPVLDDTEGAPFELSRWKNNAFTPDSLSVTDITGNAATCPLLIDTLTVKVRTSVAE